MSIRPVARVVACLSIGLAMVVWNPSKGDEPEAPDPFASARDRMVQRHLVERDIKDKRVLEAFRTVPRHRFLPPRPGDRPMTTSRSRSARARRSRPRSTSPS